MDCSLHGQTDVHLEAGSAAFARAGSERGWLVRDWGSRPGSCDWERLNLEAANAKVDNLLTSMEHGKQERLVLSMERCSSQKVTKGVREVRSGKTKGTDRVKHQDSANSIAEYVV